MNKIDLNTEDARKPGFKKDDEVKVVSSTNKEGERDLKHGNKKAIVGKIIATQTIDIKINLVKV